MEVLRTTAAVDLLNDPDENLERGPGTEVHVGTRSDALGASGAALIADDTV